MSAIYSWLAAPTNLGQVNFINLALALFGSFATIVGFGLTAWQLMRTVKATKAATDAVARIKSRVASYDAVFEISRATASLKETERHLKRHSWEEAIVSYGELRTAVVRLSELPSDLDDERRLALHRMLEEITSFTDKLEVAVERNKTPADVARAIQDNRRHSDSLTRLSIFVEGKAQ